MKTYKFKLYLTLCNQEEIHYHIVESDSYRKAYAQLLAEVPFNYSCDYFYVSPVYTVNGKERVAK